jgi:hypothetical protein
MSELLILRPPLYSMKPSPRFRFWLPISRQEEQRARQPLLAGVEEMVDKIFLDADVPREHVRNEAIGEGVLRVQELDHRALLNQQDLARRHGRRGRDAQRLTGQAAFAEKIARAEHRDDGLLSCRRHDRELHRAVLDVQHARASVALREDHLRWSVCGHPP